MTSGSVSELLANLGIDRSHSRPRTSNDNPFSEAQFKSLKYVHDFPKCFASLGDAHEFLDGFFNEYNHVHRHSGIGWHTPASVHFGTADAIDEARQTTLTAAYHANPARFGRRPTPPTKEGHRLHQRTRTATANKLISTVSFDLTNSAPSEQYQKTVVATVN